MTLWPYQLEAVEFVRRNKKAYLALDPGMGKTLTALAAAEKHAKKHILVIAEKNEIVNSQNFKKEAAALGLDYFSLREEPLPVTSFTTRCVYGINPDALKKHDISELTEHFDFVIVDEATQAKTTTTDRFKRVHKVCSAMEYVVLLSGTPMMNGAAELYAPLLLLDHALAGDGTAKARQAFETIFAGGHRRKIRNTGVYWQDYAWWAKGANHVRELRYLIRDKFFFKRKEEAGGVFKYKLRTIRDVEMSMEWLAEYKNAWDEYYAKAKTAGKNLDNITELRNLIENGQVYQVNSRWKALKIVEDIEKGYYSIPEDTRMVVFTMFIETYELLQREFSRRGITFRTFDELPEWKKGTEKVLLGRIKAHGKGGNVPEASVCVFADMDFVPANNIQAECRIDRPEQQNSMLIRYYLAKGEEVDAHVREINRDKARKIEEFMRPLSYEDKESFPRKLEALKERYPDAFKTLGLYELKASFPERPEEEPLW